MLIVIVVVAVAVVLLLFLALAFNHLVRLRNETQAGWSNIDVQLKRRNDLIPNLVEAVKGYAAHERGLFDEVTQARAAAAGGGGPAATAAASDQLSGAVGKLFAVAENYPQLRATENFQQHRGQDRRRAPVLQLGRADVQHRDPELPRRSLCRNDRVPRPRVLRGPGLRARDSASLDLASVT
jgi:hypothetical protein